MASPFVLENVIQNISGDEGMVDHENEISVGEAQVEKDVIDENLHV